MNKMLHKESDTYMAVKVIIIVIIIIIVNLMEYDRLGERSPEWGCC